MRTTVGIDMNVKHEYYAMLRSNTPQRFEKLEEKKTQSGFFICVPNFPTISLERQR